MLPASEVRAETLESEMDFADLGSSSNLDALAAREGRVVLGVKVSSGDGERALEYAGGGAVSGVFCFLRLIDTHTKWRTKLTTASVVWIPFFKGVAPSFSPYTTRIFFSCTEPRSASSTCCHYYG